MTRSTGLLILSAMSDPPPAPETIRDLLSYRIHRLANALSRGAARRYRRDFGVSLMEWRILALLGGFAPLTLRDLARESGLDKAQASRAVKALVARGLVERATGAQDAREVALRLSETGAALQHGLMQAARERDEAFRAALPPGTLAALEEAIRLLQAEARRQTPKE
ncbi:MAG: MarR family transcriptional regulator [Falsiroseomonas sp.]|nr:MarR family transcriptional regulator [Falsiroseomonas sp.]